MVKTTYALTLFAAVSLAAPVPSGQDNAQVRRDGHGNLIGAGADGSVNQILSSLAPRGQSRGNKPDLISSLPIVGGLLGGVCVESAVVHVKSSC